MEAALELFFRPSCHVLINVTFIKYLFYVYITIVWLAGPMLCHCDKLSSSGICDPGCHWKVGFLDNIVRF